MHTPKNRRCRIGRTCQAEARIRRVASQYDVPSASSKNLQMSLVQGTMLYAAELTWNGQRSVEGEYQHGQIRPLGLQAYPSGHPCSGKRPHPRGGTPRSPTGQVAQRLLAGPQDRREATQRRSLRGKQRSVQDSRLHRAPGEARQWSPISGVRTGPPLGASPSVRGARRWSWPGARGTEGPSGRTGLGSAAARWGRCARGKPSVV